MVNDLLLSLHALDKLIEVEQTNRHQLRDKAFKLGTEIHHHLEALAICERCLQEQADVRIYIEEQITALLRKVFSQDFEFKFDAIYKEDGVSLRGLRPIVKKGEIWDDLKDRGDGIRNVVSFAFRLVLLILTKGTSKTIYFDEPLLNLAKDRWAPLVDFIVDLQEYFKLQIIVNTHVHALFPETYRVFRNGKISQVEKLLTIN